jgi:hypothetical protein
MTFFPPTLENAKKESLRGLKNTRPLTPKYSFLGREIPILRPQLLSETIVITCFEEVIAGLMRFSRD